jgi:SAM-dependent methyltransferase
MEGIMDRAGQPASPAEVYEQFFVPGMFRPLAKELIESAAPEAGEAMLDLACGTGVVARTAAPRLGRSGSIVAVDLRPGMIDVARDLAPPEGAPIRWVVGDATALDLPGETFDIVCCQQGLQFFEDRMAALNETRRVLKQGGRALFALWQALDRQGLFGEIAPIEQQRLDAFGIDSSDIDLPFSFGDPDELRDLVEDAGFKDVAVFEVAIETDFPAEDFVGRVEYAYSAVVPDFVADPAAFHRFADEVAAGADEMIRRHTHGDRIRFAMHANVAVGTA